MNKDLDKRRQRIREYQKRWREAHPEYQKEWLAEHPGYMRKYRQPRKRYIPKTPEARERRGRLMRIYRRRWRLNHMEAEREGMRRRIRELTDGVVRMMLCRDSGLRAADIPDELVLLKRELVKLNRLLQAAKQELDEL